MLRTAKSIEGLKIHATDGEIGVVDDFIFDRQCASIRYLVINLHKWLPGRKVLLAPAAFESIDWDADTLAVNISRDKIKNSPDVDSRRLISRHQESEYRAYFGWPDYWGAGPMPLQMGTYGLAAALPLGNVRNNPIPQEQWPDEMVANEQDSKPLQKTECEQDTAADSKLCGINDIRGYSLTSKDGDKVGHVEDVLLDPANLQLHYLVIDTRRWLPSKDFLVFVEWLLDADWVEENFTVDLHSEAIEQAPVWNPDEPLTREYEASLFTHYGKEAYW